MVAATDINTLVKKDRPCQKCPRLLTTKSQLDDLESCPDKSDSNLYHPSAISEDQPCVHGRLPSQIKPRQLLLVRYVQRRDVVVHRDCVGLRAMAFDSCCLCKLSPRRITTSTRMYWKTDTKSEGLDDYVAWARPRFPRVLSYQSVRVGRRQLPVGLSLQVAVWQTYQEHLHSRDGWTYTATIPHDWRDGWQ